MMRVRLTALAALLLLSACGGVPFPRVEPISDEAKREALTAALVHPLGPTKILQRAIVRVGTDETNITLYVRLRPPDEVHLAAIGDLGGTVFEARRDDHGTQVLRGSPLIPERVVRALVECLTTVYLAPQASPLSLVRFSEVEAALHGADASGRELLIWPYPHGARLLGGDGGRLHSRVKVEWSRGAPASGPVHARRLGFEDGSEEVTATIEVLRFEPLAEAAPPRAGGR